MTGNQLREIPIIFYRTSLGAEPVRDWLRSALPSRRIARILFFIYEGQIIILHGFIKQTQKTPQDELESARKRMREVTT